MTLRPDVVPKMQDSEGNALVPLPPVKSPVHRFLHPLTPIIGRYHFSHCETQRGGTGTCSCNWIVPILTVFQTLYDTVEQLSRQRVENLMSQVGGMNSVVGITFDLVFLWAHPSPGNV